MIIARTRDDILKDLTARIQQLGISPLMNGITQNLVNGVVDILYSAERDRVATDNDTNPSLAIGDKLENIAAKEFGIFREKSSVAFDNTYTNFHFYISNGLTAKDITTDQTGFVVPTSTFVRDAIGNLFVTTRPAIFEKTSNSAFVPVVSVNAVNADVVSLSMNNHDFDVFTLDNVTTTSIGTEQLLCSNLKTIAAATGNESDDSLRLRMEQRANSLNQTNEQRLKSILTTIPGVTGTTLRKNKRGNGSVECILHTQIANPNEGVYARAEALILQNIYGADNIFVVKPQYIPIRMNLLIIATGTITNLAEVKSTISIGATDFINNTVVQGGTLVLADLLASLKNLVTGIDDIRIGCIYINNRRAVIQDQTSFYNQKFVVMSPIDIAVS